MIIIGHRGAKGLAPENTIAAITAGIAANADWIEIDVRATKDGKAVVIHDATTARVSSKKLLVAQTTSEKLTEAHVKTEPIPSLEQAFAAVAGKAILNVEIKSFGCVPEVVALTKRAGYDAVVVSSFSRNILDKVRSLDPKVKRALLLAFNPFAFRGLAGLYAVGFHHLFAPRSAIAAAKKLNLVTYAYTVDDPKRAAGLESRGIDGIVTNFPNKFR